MIHALSLSCQLTPDLDKPFINRHLSPYIHLLAPGVQHMGASYRLAGETKPKSLYIVSKFIRLKKFVTKVQPFQQWFTARFTEYLHNEGKE